MHTKQKKEPHLFVCRRGIDFQEAREVISQQESSTDVDFTAGMVDGQRFHGGIGRPTETQRRLGFVQLGRNFVERMLMRWSERERRREVDENAA